VLCKLSRSGGGLIGDENEGRWFVEIAPVERCRDASDSRRCKSRSIIIMQLEQLPGRYSTLAWVPSLFSLLSTLGFRWRGTDCIDCWPSDGKTHE
jgi:hypothetical protein